jgi:predicted transposase YdaD
MHGRAEDTAKALEIATVAMEASSDLEADRSVMYFDLIYASLSEAARKSFLTMDPAKYEFQSDFAKRYVAQGELQGERRGQQRGEQRGRAQTLLSLLDIKFGPLDREAVSRVEDASIEELKLWTERVLEAKSLYDVLQR